MGRRRISRATLLVAAVLGVAPVVLPGTAWAKFPPFTVEVAPSVPRVGETVTVVVRTYLDAEHTVVADWNMGRRLGGLLWAFRERPDGGLSRASRIGISPRWTGPGTYEGKVRFPAPGAWSILAFSGGSVVVPQTPPGYPDRIDVRVLAPAATGTTGTTAAPAKAATEEPSRPRGAWTLGALAALAALGVGALAAHRGHPHAGERRLGGGGTEGVRDPRTGAEGRAGLRGRGGQADRGQGDTGLTTSG